MARLVYPPRERALARAVLDLLDGLMFAADSMERGGCWCGPNWTGPHHDYCRKQRARIRRANKALAFQPAIHQQDTDRAAR